MKSHRKRLILFAILLLAYMGFGIFYASKLNEEGKAYKHYMEKSVGELGTITRFGDQKEWIDIGMKLFHLNPIYDEAGKKKVRSEYYLREAMAHKENTIRWSWFFASISIAVLILTIVLYLSHFFVHGYMAMMLIAVSMVCLWVGISSPMMEIMAYNEGIEFEAGGVVNIFGWEKDLTFSPEFEGKFYHYYQSKSVLDLIHILFEAKNAVVAIAILLFSIIFPILKLLISFTAMAFPSTHRFKISRIIIHKLGKWSMADVFVAAMFLSFLSFQNMSDQVETDSKILPGLYYFIAFSVLSITSSYFVELAVKKHDEEMEKMIHLSLEPDRLNKDVN